MNMVQVVLSWNQYYSEILKQLIKQNNFNRFIKQLAYKQQFWYANIWMCVFTEQYYKLHPKSSHQEYLRYADHAISSLPDLFNDRLKMQAHGLLWKYKFKMFFDNINATVYLLSLFSEQLKKKY